jgi:hypothetical protein
MKIMANLFMNEVFLNLIFFCLINQESWPVAANDVPAMWTGKPKINLFFFRHIFLLTITY